MQSPVHGPTAVEYVRNTIPRAYCVFFKTQAEREKKYLQYKLIFSCKFTGRIYGEMGHFHTP